MITMIQDDDIDHYRLQNNILGNTLCIVVVNTFASHLRLKEELFWFSNVPIYQIEVNDEVRNVSFADKFFAHFPSMVCEIQ